VQRVVCKSNTAKPYCRRKVERTAAAAAAAAERVSSVKRTRS